MSGRGKYRLYGAKGSGSMIVEAAFGIADLPVELVDLDWSDLGWQSRTLADLNPLGQVPTLVLPNGSVMTESAAMILHLGDMAPDCGLVPTSSHPQRAEFLRWLMFLVSAVYPTFTYGDDPKRWLDGDDAMGKRLRDSTDLHRKKLFHYVEGQIEGPWFLDATFSALDLYLWPMTYWRPKRPWFEENCPKLHRIGVAMDKHPVCSTVARRQGL